MWVFADDLYVIWDRATRTEIGADRLTDDIFCYSHAQAFHTSVLSFESFHKRLGHPLYLL